MSAHEQQTKMAYVEWYAMPEAERVPRTKQEWAETFGVPERTLTSWQKATWFREALSTLYGQLNVSPERVQKVLDAAHTVAVGGNTKAMEIYLRYIEAISPKKVVVESKAVQEMTDDELSAKLREAAAELDRREANA